MLPLPLERLVQTYLDHLEVERGASPNTIASYRRDLGRYVAYLAQRGITQADEIGANDIRDFAASLRQGDDTHTPLAPSSAARAVVAVRSLHRFAAAEGATAGNAAAAVVPPRQGRRLPKALSLGQVQALLDAPDRGVPAGLRDAVLLELLYGTGARISEIVALDVDDLAPVLVEPDAGLRLFGKGRKERIVPVASYARGAVEAWLVRGRPAMVIEGRGTPALLVNGRGGRLSRQSAWAILQGQAGRAHLDAQISPHTLRHSFATHMLDGGADIRVVQELLGHASVTTTQIYTLVTAEHLREVFLTSHPRAR